MIHCILIVCLLNVVDPSLTRNDQASMGTWCYSTREERQVWMSTFAYRLREGGMRKEILEKELGWTAEQLDDMADECEKTAASA